jgi:hypothetical protein
MPIFLKAPGILKVILIDLKDREATRTVIKQFSNAASTHISRFPKAAGVDNFCVRVDNFLSISSQSVQQHNLIL